MLLQIAEPCFCLTIHHILLHLISNNFLWWCTTKYFIMIEGCSLCPPPHLQRLYFFRHHNSHLFTTTFLMCGGESSCVFFQATPIQEWDIYCKMLQIVLVEISRWKHTSSRSCLVASKSNLLKSWPLGYPFTWYKRCQFQRCYLCLDDGLFKPPLYTALVMMSYQQVDWFLLLRFL